MLEASDFSLQGVSVDQIATLVDTADSLIEDKGICSGRSCLNCPFSMYWRSKDTPYSKFTSHTDRTKQDSKLIRSCIEFVVLFLKESSLCK